MCDVDISNSGGETKEFFGKWHGQRFLLNVYIMSALFSEVEFNLIVKVVKVSSGTM